MGDLFHVYMEGQLEDALDEVEMPASYYEKARNSYGSLSRHLLREGSEIAEYGPEVFLQGSIRTGTAIRPITDDGSYDVDALPHHRAHGMTEIDAVAVTVSATKTRSGGVPKPFSSGDELPKRVSLRFTAHAEGIKNFRVRWQVTNDGREALQANCLRGDFYESAILKDGRKTRVESTLYAGRHYVECILERDGVVYGRSEPFVVNIVDGASANRNW